MVWYTKYMRNQSGFTLIELVMIIVILAIIAAVAIPRMGDVTSMKAAATAEKIKSDIRYAQELAMTRNRSYRVYFNSAPAPGSGYAVVNDANNNGTWGEAGEFAQDPTGSGNLSVTLNAGDYAGVTASSSVNPIEFNSLGRPTGGATTITVSPGGYTITVAAETGAVN
jgi:MSHA pilin protein MshC